MTSPHPARRGQLDRSLPPLGLPELRLVRPLPEPGPDALGTFVPRTRSWGRVQAPLSGPVTGALWFVLVAAGAVGGWLAAVLTGRAPCSGLLCSIATLGDHPGPLLVLACFCVAALLGSATVTGGLSRAGAPELALIMVAAIAGVISLLGVLAVVILVALALALAVSTVALLIPRSGRL